jgi:hypothetical protein
MTHEIPTLFIIGLIFLFAKAFSTEEPKPKYVDQREDDYYDEYDDYYDEDEITEAEVIETETNEEIQIRELIKELKSKPGRSKKDQYNIDLLNVKLNQLKYRR